ncbi:hypothetical protein T281_06195 [Rhodomicrobium udaipurense JA643]|nr:hypothetical protein T281_06195 [Rhodomicrobium udaipurense JA643]
MAMTPAVNAPGTLSDIAHVYLFAFALSLPRAYAMFSFVPITTRLGLPELLRATTVLAIMLPVIEPFAEEIRKVPEMTAFTLAALCIKEAVIGIMLGLVLGLPFWALEVAGNILDFVRQAPDAQLQDPQGTTESSITGTLLSIFVIFVFLAYGGFGILTDVVYTSFGAWPMLELAPALATDAVLKFGPLLDKLFRMALVLAAPVLAMILLAFLILIMIARFVPQINVFDLSMSARNIAFFIALPIYLVFVLDYLMPELAATKTVVETVRAFLHG